MAEDSHYTFREAGEFELIVRRSRFLGWAVPAASHAAAQDWVCRLRAAHPKANHHVSAWRVLATGQSLEHRFDDDGEPGGTAGRPILQVLAGRSLVNAAVIVVRYFGGIKLGAGGLVRAYGETAAKAADAAVTTEIIPQLRLRIVVPFEHIATIESWAQRSQVAIAARTYEPEPGWTVLIPAVEEAPVRALLTDLTHGTARIEPVGEQGPGDSG